MALGSARDAGDDGSVPDEDSAMLGVGDDGVAGEGDDSGAAGPAGRTWTTARIR